MLSHGNASVESGFSVNQEMLVENLHEESLVAQRQVYDAVLAAGGVAAVEIEKSMLQHVRGAHSRYQECLRKKRISTETRKHEKLLTEKELPIKLNNSRPRKLRLLKLWLWSHPYIAELEKVLKK